MPNVKETLQAAKAALLNELNPQEKAAFKATAGDPNKQKELKEYQVYKDALKSAQDKLGVSTAAKTVASLTGQANVGFDRAATKELKDTVKRMEAGMKRLEAANPSIAKELKYAEKHNLLGTSGVASSLAASGPAAGGHSSSSSAPAVSSSSSAPSVGSQFTRAAPQKNGTQQSMLTSHRFK